MAAQPLTYFLLQSYFIQIHCTFSFRQYEFEPIQRTRHNPMSYIPRFLTYDVMIRPNIGMMKPYNENFSSLNNSTQSPNTYKKYKINKNLFNS